MNSSKEKKTFIIEFIGLLFIFIGILVLILDINHSEKYTVSFHSVGGTYITSSRVLANKKVKEPIVPIREGYSFMGWYDGNKKFDFDTIITSNVDLEAKWKKENEEIDSIKEISVGKTVRLGLMWSSDSENTLSKD